LILSEGGDDFKREDETICGAANAPPAAMPAFLINSLLLIPIGSYFLL